MAILSSKFYQVSLNTKNKITHIYSYCLTQFYNIKYYETKDKEVQKYYFNVYIYS